MTKLYLPALLGLTLLGCSAASGPAEPAGGNGGTPGAAGSGGSGGGSGDKTGGTSGSGSSTGGASGSGGAAASGSGGSSTGSGGTGAPGTGGAGDGSGGSGQGGATGADAAVPEAGAPSDAPAGTRPPPGPTPAGQGPTAEGKIVYSQDFEVDMVGMNRGPKAVPPDRVTIVDDPLKERGKVLKVVFQQGDNFRTSAGTQPRTWVSNRPNGYEFAPGAKVSHAFGIMTDKTNMNYAFAQVISTGGPVWMLIGGGDGKLTVFCNACGDANTTHFVIEANKWHDFRVDMDFRSGGAVRFFHNGQMFRQSTLANTRGGMGHWDGGIYNRPAGTGGPTRTVYIGNLSVGVQP